MGHTDDVIITAFLIISNFFFFFPYLPSPNLRLTLPRLTIQMPMDQMLAGEQQSLDQNTRQIHKDGSPWMCGQHGDRASAEDNTGQNTSKGHTPNPRTEIKIPDPAWNRNRPPGWKVGTLPTTPRRRINI